MSNIEDQDSFVKRPYSPEDMEAKLNEIRTNVSKKMNKWADRITVSMAYTPQIQRVEGELWTENNKQWVMKDGVKQSVSNLTEARMPWWCPKCTKPMNHRFDRKFYYLRGMCYNCNIDWEGQLRIEGKWEAFEKRTVRENEKAYLRDKIQENQDYIRTFKIPQLHFGDGRWEEIAVLSDFQKVFDELEKDCEFCVARLEQIAKEEQEETDATMVDKLSE